MPAIDLNFKLHPKQRQFVESEKPWCAFIGGLGGGKTYSGAVKSLLATVQFTGSLGIISAPNYTMLRDTTQRMFFDLLPQQLIKSFNKNEQHLVMTNGSEVLFRSMDDPNKVRGINAAWAWLDEAPYAGYYAWQILKQRVGRQNRRGLRQAWITGTPKGRDGYWKEFVLNPSQDHFFIQSSTFENLNNLPDDYVQSMNFTGSFYEQEIMGSFEAFEGLVYAFDANEGSPTSHIGTVPDNKRFRHIIGGIDWGYTNPAVALVFGVDGDMRVWQLAEFYQRQTPIEEMIAEVIEMTARWGVEDWWCDPAEPEHIDRLKSKMDDAMLPCEVWKAENSIVPGIQTVQRFLAVRGDGLPGLVVAPSCVNTISEFLSYQYDKNPMMGDDAIVKEKPKGNQNDHAMDSLRYAIHSTLGQSIQGIPVAILGKQGPTVQQIGEDVRKALPQPVQMVDEDGLPIMDVWWSTNDLFEERQRKMHKFMNFLDGLGKPK